MSFGLFCVVDKCDKFANYIHYGQSLCVEHFEDFRDKALAHFEEEKKDD